MVIRRRTLRFIEAEGFYQGVQLVSADPAMAELQAHFERTAGQVKHDAIETIKGLEAREMILTRQQTDAEAHWRRLEAETRGMPPEAMLPLVASALAVLAVVGETILLAPVMDGFGIADPVWQLVLAGTLVTVAAGLVHATLRQLSALMDTDAVTSDDRSSFMLNALPAILAAFVVVTISILGLWRADQMVFVAEVQQGDWGQFLSRHSTLTKICVTLLTLGLPIFSALAFEWGFERLRYARAWRRAHRVYARSSAGLESARKQLEAVIQKREARLTMLQAESEEWQQVQREHHELGVRVGAQPLPFWRVAVTILAVVALATAGCLLMDPLVARQFESGRGLLYACVVVGVGALYTHRALKAWERPTPIQLYRQRPVVWREPSPACTVRQTSAQEALARELRGEESHEIVCLESAGERSAVADRRAS